MQVLVTGAAGFIGSNFVRHWVNEHPGDGVVALDLLTYAGNRDNLADIADRITFVEGDIGDLDLVSGVLERESIDVIVNFAAESHNSLAVLDPLPLPPYQRARHASAARGGARPRHRPLPPHLHVRGLRRPRARRPRLVHRRLALPSAHAVQRVEGVGRPLRPRVPRDLRRPDHDLELLEQLRAVPVPGEGRPVLHDARARRQAAPVVRVDRPQTRVAPRARPLPRHRADRAPRPRRRDLQRGQRPSRPPSTRSPTSCSTRSGSPTR